MLRSLFNGFLDEALEAAGMPQLGRAFSALAGHMGYERAVMLDAGRFDGDMRAAILFAAQSKSELSAFGNENNYADHPLVRHAAATDAPFLLEALRQQQAVPLDRWLAALPPEIRAGQTLMLPVHRESRLMLLGGLNGLAPDTTPLACAMLHTAAHVFYDRVVALRARPQDAVALTNRESECIRWVAHGKSDAEISALVGISARTVRYHLHNAKTKLGAVSRLEALAKLAGGARRSD